MCAPVAVTVGVASSSGASVVLIGQITALIAVAGVFIGNLWRSLRKRRSMKKE